MAVIQTFLSGRISTFGDSTRVVVPQGNTYSYTPRPDGQRFLVNALGHKQHTGVKSMTFDDLVREALCFGWVDSLIKRLGDHCYAIKVTPRKPASKWSESNRRRWNQLKADGLLAASGLAAAPTRNSYAPKPAIPELPAYIAKAFKTNVKAWQYFQALAPTYRRHFVWIHIAKRSETRESRIRESIELLSAGKKLGLK